MWDERLSGWYFGSDSAAGKMPLKGCTRSRRECHGETERILFILFFNYEKERSWMSEERTTEDRQVEVELRAFFV
jgi:hypothetical protein